MKDESSKDNSAFHSTAQCQPVLDAAEVLADRLDEYLCAHPEQAMVELMPIANALIIYRMRSKS